ncbi:glycerophosphodiester phosphodiesterase family protein [Mucilaginibacter paludis]|uniref:Glycerophosphoryl diester phosphodiesterase n=1 Tax=Mucilaginibacter paludis DSM 18603 TaxID=714943 RepID=H1Y8K3_9SPHI|nr:glycerophosphodiester phosphodiesterase family protein [Mucilaginibacter paludis]EHQ25921.1 glycerophosphoryl diester phosphodiesterase [Mucilaginibacter paludis DSM 18603]
MNKHQNLALAFFLIAFSQMTNAQSLTRADSLVKQLHNPADKKIMVTAHRGDWRNAPENSLAAFKNAIKMGVDIIELDLAQTKDGVIVIMHDQTIDRTTNGKGKPGDFTLSEIKSFRLKNGLGRVTDHTIPTLQEVMLLVKGKVLINLDKSYPYYNEAYAILKNTGTLKQAIFKTDERYAEVKKRYPSILDSITFMAVIDLDKPDARQILTNYQQYMHPVAFELNFKTDTSSLLRDNKFINTNGSRIWINSLWASLNAGHDDDTAVDKGNTRDSWDWLIAHGATMIQTDRPKELLLYLKQKGLHR